MMTLSRLQIDPLRRQTLLAMANRNKIHGAVEQAKMNRDTKVLWRLEQLKDAWYLLLLHNQPINLAFLQEQFGFASCPAQSKDYSVLIDHIQKGQQWQFKLQAAPMFSEKTNEPGQRGRKLVHKTITVQKLWLEKKAPQIGVSLDWFEITASQPVLIKKGKDRKGKNNGFSFYAVTYEGILTVENPDPLKSALIDGIGREKAYGMGLMTLIPVRISE